MACSPDIGNLSLRPRRNFLRRWKLLAMVALGSALFGLGAVLAAGWYYSDVLKEEALEPEHEAPKRDLEVVALDEGHVTLWATDLAEDGGDWQRDGVFGLEWDGGYGRVGSILTIQDKRVVREFMPIEGLPAVGVMARLDSFAYPGDPEQAHGIHFEDVTFRSPAGDMPAWFIDGPRDSWVIFVHGKGADRREALRVLPTITALVLPSLVITYRNDREVLVSADSLYRYGQTEWQDLEAAAEYALAHGAQKLLLAGYSMGGSIVASFLYRSPLSERVAGVIFDAPMLDLSATIDLGARKRDVPGIVSAIGKRIAAARFDIDWRELNYLSRMNELAVPILLFHGDADERVPVETSDALAAGRPDIVTYVRVPGAGHIRAWNSDPGRYDAAVLTFLERRVGEKGERGEQSDGRKHRASGLAGAMLAKYWRWP